MSLIAPRSETFPFGYVFIPLFSTRLDMVWLCHIFKINFNSTSIHIVRRRQWVPDELNVSMSAFSEQNLVTSIIGNYDEGGIRSPSLVVETDAPFWFVITNSSGPKSDSESSNGVVFCILIWFYRTRLFILTFRVFKAIQFHISFWHVVSRILISRP